MTKKIKGMTSVEMLIGFSLLIIVTSGILGLFIVIQQYFKDGIALINAQGSANIVIEKFTRPVRHAKSFAVSDEGDTLTLVMYDDSVDVFEFCEEDGTLEKNGNIIGANIVRISDKDIFQELKANELIGLNFGLRNQGVLANDKEVQIETEIKLRN
jgi:hypothetical protein